METCKGIQVSVQYQAGVPISLDIGMFAPRILLHIFFIS